MPSFFVIFIDLACWYAIIAYMHQHLEPYILYPEEWIACYNEQEAAFFALHKEQIADITKYDLVKILEEFEESYRIDYNPALWALTGESLIASHRGNDYHSKSGGARGHSFPTIGNHALYNWGFHIDAKTKRMLYNPSAMLDGRDSYFLHKNTLQTQVPLEPILYQFLLKGYTIWQTTYIKHPEMLLPYPDIMDGVHMTNAVKNAFFETTGFSPQETYVVEGRVELESIQKNELLPRKGWPIHSSQEELIDILKKEHWKLL